MKRVLTILIMLSCGVISAQTYHIGDLYTAPDGSRGIVYYLHPDGSGGWVVALNDASTGCTWGASNDVPGLANQNPSYYQQLLNDTAGYANTQVLRNYQNNSTTYAAGKVDFAHGWVLPSPAQLSILYGQLPFIASAITGAGGTALAYTNYWCSAENSASNAWCVDFGTNYWSGYFNNVAKTTSCRVRAVRSFTNSPITYDTALTYQWNTGSTQPFINVNPAQTTTYQVTATTDYGCSNTAEQTVLVGSGIAQTIYDTICKGAGYEANGFSLSEGETNTEGTLTRTRTMTTSGCSSTLTLRLMVKSPVAELVEATACGSYIWNGVTYYESGDYTQTFTAANGCDSVVTMTLTINPSTAETLYASVLESNFPYMLNGSAYSSAGTYTQTLTNARGCDSVLTLVLTSIPLEELPDNIDSADCTFLPEGTGWGIGEPIVSAMIASMSASVPLVGDIDDDGRQEIVMHTDSKILIFNSNAELKNQFNMCNTRQESQLALAKVLYAQDEYKTIIVAYSSNNYFYAYDASGQLLWQSNQPFSSYNSESYKMPAISFADFNNDGWTEMFAGSEIYDAATGVFLCKTNDNKGHAGRTWESYGTYQSSAADLLGDASLELAVGNTVYAVDLQSRSDASLNQISPLKTISSANMVMEEGSVIPFTDGNTFLLDINLDGQLDVLVMNEEQSGRVIYLYVWDVVSQSILCSKRIPNARKFGMPQIGDIDSDGFPEICFVVGTYPNHQHGNNETVFALKYNEQSPTGEMDVFWTTPHSDYSGATSLTLFDFNQDGYSELVYRDENHLRIINGSMVHHQTGEAVTAPYDMALYACGSGTALEYPIVCDVDQDGAAEIIIASSCNSSSHVGHLYIFKSAGVPWAPARKVWNQYMYSVTNVNEDLTIPQYLFNNATAFTDPQGVVRRPFNNFLQQATTIDQYGRPFYAVPDVAVGPSASSQMVGDSLVLTFSYCNNGDKTLNAPYPITVFANAYGGDTVCTVTINGNLPVDSCTQGEVRLPVSALCGFPNLDSLVVAVNGNNLGIAQNGGLQPECDTTNNTVSVPVTIHTDMVHLTATACDSYLWYGDTLTQSGEYTHTITNAAGCDSIVTLHLTIHYGTHNAQTESACDSFAWHGTTYTQSGAYTYAYTNADGCASVDTLYLTISPADSAEFAEIACESYTWNGTSYTESGDYTQTLTNAAGCDSVVTLHLTITPLPTLSHTPDTVIHAGDSAHLWASGADVLYWTDTDGNILAAGSSLTVNPANPTMYYLTGQNYSAAMGNNLVVNGDFEQGNIGFNSAYTYVTNHMAWGSYAITTNALWAWGENGQPLYGHGGTGLYMLVDGATTPNFMAWQETVPVTPNTYYAFSTQVASTGSSYDFALLQFSINGTQLGPIFHSPNVLNTWQPFYEVWYSGNNTSATLTILNQNTTTYGNDFGLDDIVFAPLSDCSVIDSVWVSVYNDATIDQRTICENELPYEWNGVLFEHADTVEVVLPSSTGADSTVVMHLTINYGTHNSDTVTACGSHKWHGTTYTMSGIYTYSYANAAGCESTDTLHLTVSSADYAVATEIACEEYEWEGVTYAESGIYTQTLTNASGCDSTVTLHLTIHHGTHNVQTDTACNSYEWHDVTYNTSGTYTYAYMNADSCPSVDTLHLTINYADSAEFTAIACEEYEWGGTVYTETGDYTRTLTNTSGCDSTVTLHLTIHHGTHNVQTDTACNSYEWHDVTYTTSGIYTYTYMNADSCPSVDTLHLTINSADSVEFVEIACEEYEWGGTVYTETGDYTRILTNASGCDSTVTLHLTIRHGTHNVQTDTACNSYEWHDVTYTLSGTYTYAYMNADSCPSVDTLHLTVQPCDVSVIIDSVVCANALPLVWNGMVFTQADTQVVVIPASNGADSIVTMVLHVNLLTDSTIHADVLQNNLPYILNNTPYNTPGTYVQHLTNAAGCDSTLTLVLTVLYNSTTQMDTTLCASALPFTWNDSVFTAAGTKTRIYSASNGADSLVVMTLSLFPQPEAVVTGPTVICDGAPVILTANSAQSYLWSTGATTQSVTVSQEGHYTLLVTNEFGCSDTTFHNVFELLNPIVDAHVSEMCAGGSYLVTVGYQQESNIQLGHGETTLSVADTIFLPDGIYCEPFGCSYQSPVTFTAYADGDTIQSADDIYYVRLNIEHSFIGDLYINITCPNGQKADLLKYGGTGSSECNSQIAPSSRGWMSGDNMSVVNHLGVIHPGSSSSCDPSAYGNEPGTGWNYCWSNNTTQGYTYASGAGGYIYRAGNEHNTIVDSSNVAAGTQFYHPDDSFTSLIGCPLNGSWYIEVQDGWSVDNGYLFGWELALSTDMLPQRNFILENATADGPWITNVSDSLFRIEPPADLAHDTVISYTFTVYDTSGCSYDTTISITFHALPRMEMDTTVCGSLEWNGDVYTESGQYEWTYPTDHCDSTFVLNLTIAEPFESTLEDVICEGDGYNANGFVVAPMETVGAEELHRELTLQSESGCDSIVHLTLTVIDTALLIVPLTEDFCESQSMELMVVTPMPDYIWSTGESAPTITVTTPGYYSVTATQGDCSATARVLVQGCTYGFYLPNAITPSRGDGLNDYFCIPEAYLDNIALFEISIVNRWGEQVYYSTDKHFKWNGEYRGSIQYQTIYNYVIRYTDTSGRPYTRTGAVTVL